MKVRIHPWPGETKKVAVFTGITCNLACVVCGPGASSKWRSELGMGKYSDEEYELVADEIFVEIDDYDWFNLEHVTFTGGEPMLNQSTLLILKKLNPECNVHFHSNGTQRPSNDYLIEFAKFKSFDITFSIDDVEEQFEYLRWPAKWSEVIENILWCRENCPLNVRFEFNSVVSKLNASTHHRVGEWVQEHFSTNRAGVKTQWYTNETNGLLNRIKKTDNRDEQEFLQKLDQRRGLDWRQTFPLIKL